MTDQNKADPLREALEQITDWPESNSRMTAASMRIIARTVLEKNPHHNSFAAHSIGKAAALPEPATAQAIMILELRQSTVPTAAPVPIKALEHIRLHLLNEYQMDLYKAKFPELEAALEAVGKGTE